jgi:hypothetical protein
MLNFQGVVMVSPGDVASRIAVLAVKAAATPGAAPRSAAMFYPAGGVTALPRPIVAVPYG